MRGLVLFTFLISTIVVCVLSENDQASGAAHEASEVAVRADQLTHGHRSKRSPYDPIVPTLLLGKSFLLGALVGKGLGWGRRGWGGRPRFRTYYRAPVVVHHSHSHGGWGGGGYSELPIVSSGYGGGWAR